MIHNISQNWMQGTYGFGVMANLVFSHFYFSCKNYQESDYASITKVVVFFTTNTTKLILHFSEFYYDFLRNSQDSAKQQYYLRFTFAPGSLERFGILQIYPYFADLPLERTEVS
jgi:hypothetical protein